VRGFGFMHDGSAARIFDFLFFRIFELSDADRLNLEEYLFAFESNLAPIVGQQITLTARNGEAVAPRLELMQVRAQTSLPILGLPGAKECDLVVKGNVGGQSRGYFLEAASARFRTDRAAEPRLTDSQLRALAATPGQELTFTCVPPGSGERLGLDRDGDGFFDRDEIDAGSDPTDAKDTPFGLPTPTPTMGPTPTPTRPRLRCVGDCDRDGSVSVDEIVVGVNILLGVQPTSRCLGFDENGDGEVTVDELILSVSTALGLPGFLCSL
jgi:hypothetical protein